jgi:hypothetical protein
MVPFLTKKKSFNRSFPNGIGSLIADDVVIISKRAIPTQVLNMLTDDEISKVIINHHHTLLSLISTVLLALAGRLLLLMLFF